MTKRIDVPETVLARLLEGKCVEGSLKRDEWTGRISFRAYNRRPQVRRKDRMIRRLEHGWVKESVERIKVFESVPKAVGTTRVMAVIDRETQEVKEALMERELDLLEF